MNSRFIRLLASVALLLLPVSPARASFELGVGGSLGLASSTIDHSKWGPHLELALNPGTAWGADLQIDLLTSTLAVVNPGAGGNPTAPDQDESTSGSKPLLAQAFLRLPPRIIGATLSVGSITYYPDFAGTLGGVGIPFTAAARLGWNLWGADRSSLQGRLSLSFGVNPLGSGQVTLIEIPELGARWRWGKSAALDVSTQGVLTQVLGGPSWVQLQPTLALVFSL